MRWRVSFSALILAASAAVMAQGPGATIQSSSAAPRAQSTALPVRRVVLYKIGVGYFEHLGNVRNRQDVAVRFTSAQLNDVLKSLTAIDLGAGQVTGISYNSIAPIDQRLGALRLPVGSAATRMELLAALRGARVAVSSGAGAATGRLLSVERQARGKDNEHRAAGGSTEALQRALAPIFVKRSELAVLDRQLAVLEQQQNTIVQDQQRLRENLKALRGSSEEKQLLQRYTRQLDDQENKLEALRREMAETATRRDATREELGLLIANFTYEA
jgi:hypothetical protein